MALFVSEESDGAWYEAPQSRSQGNSKSRQDLRSNYRVKGSNNNDQNRSDRTNINSSSRSANNGSHSRNDIDRDQINNNQNSNNNSNTSNSYNYRGRGGGRGGFNNYNNNRNYNNNNNNHNYNSQRGRGYGRGRGSSRGGGRGRGRGRANYRHYGNQSNNNNNNSNNYNNNNNNRNNNGNNDTPNSEKRYSHLPINTQLIIAIKQDRQSDVLELIRQGANVDCIDHKDKEKRNALTTAVIRGNLEIIELLMQNGAKWSHCSHGEATGRTAMHFAARFSKIDSMNKLYQLVTPEERIQMIEYPTLKYAWTPLHLACYYKQYEAAKWLLANGANVLAKTENGKLAKDFVKRVTRNKETNEMFRVNRELIELIEGYETNMKNSRNQAGEEAAGAAVGGEASSSSLRTNNNNKFNTNNNSNNNNGVKQGAYVNDPYDSRKKFQKVGENDENNNNRRNNNNNNNRGNEKYGVIDETDVKYQDNERKGVNNNNNNNNNDGYDEYDIYGLEDDNGNNNKNDDINGMVMDDDERQWIEPETPGALLKDELDQYDNKSINNDGGNAYDAEGLIITDTHHQYMNNNQKNDKNNNNNNNNNKNDTKYVEKDRRHYYIDDIGKLRKIIDDLIKERNDYKQRVDFLTKKSEQVKKNVSNNKLYRM